MLRPPLLRSFGGAVRHSSRASGQRGANAQPGSSSPGRGGWPSMSASRSVSGVSRRGTEAQQRRGVGMRGGCEQFAHRRRLDDAAGVHHRHAIGDAGDHAEVVGDQHQRQVPRRAASREQREHLGLHRDVECRGGLVGDQQVGPQVTAPWRSRRAGACRRTVRADTGRRRASGIGHAHGPQQLERCAPVPPSRRAGPGASSDLRELPPMVRCGVSAFIGSWNTIARREPRSGVAARSPDPARAGRAPSKCAAPRAVPRSPPAARSCRGTTGSCPSPTHRRSPRHSPRRTLERHVRGPRARSPRGVAKRTARSRISSSAPAATSALPRVEGVAQAVAEEVEAASSSSARKLRRHQQHATAPISISCAPSADQAAPGWSAAPARRGRGSSGSSRTGSPAAPSASRTRSPVPSTFGTMWRAMMRCAGSAERSRRGLDEFPAARNDSVWPRTMRAMVSQPTAPIARKISTQMLRPNTIESG